MCVILFLANCSRSLASGKINKWNKQTTTSDMYNGSRQKCTKTNLWNFLGTDQAGPVTDKSAHLWVWITPEQCNIIRFDIKPGVRRKLLISHISKTTAVAEQSPRTLSQQSGSETEETRPVRTLLMPLPMLRVRLETNLGNGTQSCFPGQTRFPKPLLKGRQCCSSASPCAIAGYDPLHRGDCWEM